MLSWAAAREKARDLRVGEEGFGGNRGFGEREKTDVVGRVV